MLKHLDFSFLLQIIFLDQHVDQARDYWINMWTRFMERATCCTAFSNSRLWTVGLSIMIIFAIFLIRKWCDAAKIWDCVCEDATGR